METEGLFSEFFDLLAQIPPASSSGVRDSGNVDVEGYHRVFVAIHVGAIADTGTLDADLEQASSTAAGTRKAITGKSITQLTTDDDDCVVYIELRTEELDVDGDFHYVNLELTAATAASISGAEVYGVKPRFLPAGNALVEEIVN